MADRYCASGCQDAARIGYLCPGCWDRLERILTHWPSFSGVVIYFGRLVQRDSEGRRNRPDGYTTLTPGFLDVDEADSYLRSLAAAGGDPAAWVATVSGAHDAARFIVCAERAMRAHELAERDGKLRRWRCPTCHATNPNELTLWLKQPKWAGDERVISCINRCGYEVSMDRAGEIAAVEAHAAAAA